jgi:signal transduction histidine kinase
MRNPWQIWFVFLLCLAAVIPAMVWLTFKTIEVDSLRETDRIETELARREAELQERISSALYRMDFKLLPLVAQEAARPYYLYQSFYQVANPTLETPIDPLANNEPAGKELRNAESGPVDVPSPLLFEPPEFIKLHFQIGPENQITSPQRPVGEFCEQAMVCCGITQTNIDENSVKLEAASQLFDYQSLLPKCPEIKLPPIAVNRNQALPSQSLAGVYNVPAIEKIREQIIDNQSIKGSQEQPPQGKYALQQSRGEFRTNEEFNRRRDSTKNFAGQQWAAANAFDNQLALGNLDAQTISNLNIAVDSRTIREGVMQPLWIKDNLVLARRVDGNDQPFIQCCWLDWDAIQNSLKAEVADLLPDVRFQPVKEDTDLKLGSALTTIPVQLLVDSPQVLSTLALDSRKSVTRLSGLKMSLLVAWCGLGLAALASALLLHGVVKLSERRATFVSAVTHELRTPLTTFRMYAEMLAEKMVPADRQQDYANTLRVEADRLSHLVENVLQFARLERGADQGKPENVVIKDAVERFSPRLVERACGAEMELTINMDPQTANTRITTQPSTIEQILFNLVDNACKYAKPSSDNRIEISVQRLATAIQFCVRDHGPGVGPRYKRRMFQPFCKSDQDAANTAPGVGLGLALCQRMARSLGGRLDHKDCDDGALFVLELPL